MDFFNKLIKKGTLKLSGLDKDFNSYRVFEDQGKTFRLTLTEEQKDANCETDETIEEKAAKILMTWSKGDLIGDILGLTSKEGLIEFVEQNKN